MGKITILILASSLLFSCVTKKVTATIERDSTRVEIRVDTAFVIQQDTIRFDSLLANHLLLEEKIDSLESLPEPQDVIVKDKRSEYLYKLYKKRYSNLVELRQGADKDTTYVIERDVKISSKDTTYIQPLRFKIGIVGDSLGFDFNQNLQVLSIQTTKTTTINRKIGFFAWLKSKYTLYLLVLLAISLIVYKLIRR